MKIMLKIIMAVAICWMFSGSVMAKPGEPRSGKSVSCYMIGTIKVCP